MGPSQDSAGTFTSSPLRFALLASTFLQWSSGIVVVGIVAYFTSHFGETGHIKYWIIVASLNTWTYGVVTPLALVKSYKGYLPAVHLLFSSLWMASFILAVEDYNNTECVARSPVGVDQCGKKHALEAFIFLAFFFSFLCLLLDAFLFVTERRKTRSTAHTSSTPAPAPAPAPATSNSALEALTKDAAHNGSDEIVELPKYPEQQKTPAKSAL